MNYRIPDLSAPKAEVLIDVPGLYDGVALSDDGKTLYYSDWNTVSVGAFDLGSGETKILYQEEGIGPADIAQADGILYVPDLPGCRILEIKTVDAEGTPKTEQNTKEEEKTEEKREEKSEEKREEKSEVKTAEKDKEEGTMTMQEMQDRMREEIERGRPEEDR